jgi:hypothetical protein
MTTQNLKQNQEVFFKTENLPYNVMAVSDQYAVVSRKLNKIEDNNLLEFEVKRGAYSSKERAFEKLKNEPVYSVLDFKNNVKAPHNQVFNSFDMFKTEDCQKLINSLEKGEVELSERNKVDLCINWGLTPVIND